MKASILTACYNCSPWLKQCIKSVLSQKYKDWEWIIVNDHSTDNSLRTISKYVKGDDRVKIINNKSRLKCGGSYAKALKHATGDICCVIESDYVVSSDKSLLRLVSLYDKYTNVSYIWTQFNFCDPYLKVTKKGSCCLPDSSFLQSGLDYTKYRHCFSHWRTFRTSLRGYGNIFNDKLPAAVDKWMGYRLEELGVGGFYPKVLYLYRQRLGGLSFTGRKHWKRMLSKFNNKRQKENITVYPKIKLVLP